jgi:hypothetical protein
MSIIALYINYFHADIRQAQMASTVLQIKSSIVLEETDDPDVDGQLASILQNLHNGDSVQNKVDDITGKESTLCTPVPTDTQVAVAADSLLLLKHGDTKRVYVSLGTTIGEGLKVRDMFIASELGNLKHNFTLETKLDPNSPLDCNVKLPKAGGYQKFSMNKKFWAYSISEYGKHQQKRIFKGEKPL